MNIRSDTKMMQPKSEVPYYFKYLSLTVLVVQNVMVVLIGRYATTKQTNGRFLKSSAVIMAEIVKLGTCIVVLLFRLKSVPLLCLELYDSIVVDYRRTLQVSIPSLIYVIQNNLLLVALANLETAVFQVSYQLKILTTAVMSVLLLNRRLSSQQWLALLLLFVGVVVVNLSANPSKTPDSDGTKEYRFKFRGLLAVIITSCTSAFAGVYFELLVKKTTSDLFMTNVQLSLSGIVFSLINALVFDWKEIYQRGFLSGFSIYVWAYIGMQAFGGLLIGMVVKYADNILKGFSTSIAIIVSSVLAYFLFDSTLTVQFIFGAFLVVSSVVIYSAFPFKRL